MVLLKNMMIEITNKCNQACPICEASVPKRGKMTMSLGLGLKILDTLINDGVETFSFTGGEPTLCWENLIALLKYCRSRNRLTRLYTNGTTLDKKGISILETCLNDLVMSLDSINPKSLQELRGQSAFLSRILKNIKLLEDSVIRLFIISVCSAVNKQDLFDLALELEKFDIEGWWIQQFIPQGIGKENAEIFQISDSEFSEIVKELKKGFSKPLLFFSITDLDTKRVFINCAGHFVDYKTGFDLGEVLDTEVRRKILNSRIYQNRRRNI